MNSKFDLIVIGDSKEGRSLVKTLATASSQLKIAFISEAFQNNIRDHLNVEYLQGKVTFIDYYRMLFGCYLDSGDRIYGTHLIFATGEVYEPFMFDNKIVPNVYNTPTQVLEKSKDAQAAVVGNDEEILKIALKVANKYKHLYICIEGIQLNCSKALQEKLKSIPSVVILPNTRIKDFLTEDGELKALKLDNYSALTCSVIYTKTKANGNTAYIPQNLFARDSQGYLITSKNLESTLVPKCFAVGSCTQKCTKNMINLLKTEILKDF